MDGWEGHPSIPFPERGRINGGWQVVVVQGEKSEEKRSEERRPILLR
jgi:hypothetical protein